MYYYLCASLPTLKFGADPGFDVAGFDEICRPHMGKKEFETLCSGSIRVSSDVYASDELCPVYRTFTRFEQYLRTWVAKKRSASEEEKSQNLPDPAEYFTFIDQELALASAQNPLEREKMVDKIRWRELDELAPNEFDFDALCVYRLKVQILEKYRTRNLESGRKNFQSAVEAISKSSESCKEQK